MHGQITLESSLGSGTTATFSIPFNKPHFTDQSTPMIDIGSIPNRLRSELSVSGCASDHDHGSSTPPQSPSETLDGTNPLPPNQCGDHGLSAPSSVIMDLEMTSPEIDRKNIHVLVVEDKYVIFSVSIEPSTNPYSAINQQIALKTIKKFGFSVNAVWNGKEALDYLLKNPSPTHPKPDIILMDVQMPILDGYRATHLIRHHSPYTAINGIHNVPIVAMTASAIQGDKEKCKKAGMDDYLAKPVKGKTLEAMLVKWALEGRRKARLNEMASTRNVNHDSTCISHKGVSLNQQLPIKSIISSENNEGARVIAESSALPGTESEGDRGLQRVEAEEKATALRDDKLIAASGAHLHHITPVSPALGPSVRPGPPTAALTEENMSILDREHDGSSTHPHLAMLRREPSGTHSSLVVESRESSPPGSTVGSLRSPAKTGRSWGAHATRSRLSRNDSERSQATITESALRE